ncbi:MAG: adenylate/guanylate cyclase domain-containing protein [Desulfobacterales bacterium]|nr:adenylate/guanylate cyclase domain-containing protein [Desulfobacterales bacterium]
MTISRHLPKQRSNRIVLFADLRDSTDILVNFDQKIYQKTDGKSESGGYTYGKFIQDVHEQAYKELYLGHENTYAEVYGDGVIGIFPEDNAKYILENIYRLTTAMRRYNEGRRPDEVLRPKMDMGFGVTIGEVGFVYYPVDERDHPVGQCIHEVARIVSVCQLYDARILVSHRFFKFAETFIASDERFSYRFIDRVILKGFREPVTLFELLMDNDPRFQIKKQSNPTYGEAYAKYCARDWVAAREIFWGIFQQHGLEAGAVMAKRCDLLAANPPAGDWNGIWRMKDK